MTAGKLLTPTSEAEAAEEQALDMLTRSNLVAAQALANVLGPLLVDIFNRVDLLARMESGYAKRAEVAASFREVDKAARKANAEAQAEAAAKAAEAEGFEMLEPNEPVDDAELGGEG